MAADRDGGGKRKVVKMCGRCKVSFVDQATAKGWGN